MLDALVSAGSLATMPFAQGGPPESSAADGNGPTRLSQARASTNDMAGLGYGGDEP